MSKRAVVFNVSDRTMIWVGAVKVVLDGIVGIGTGSVALGTTVQMVPMVTFGCFILRLFLSYFVKVWSEQAIDIEEK
jgi:hypothetical protein